MLRATTARLIQFDFTGLGSKLSSDAARAELESLRRSYEEVRKNLEVIPDEIPAVNWAAWEKEIKSPGLVQSFKDAHSKITFPTLEDTFTADAKAGLNEVKMEAEKLAADSTARIVELEKEISSIDATKSRLGEITVDEALELNPKIKTEIEKELKEYNFGY